MINFDKNLFSLLFLQLPVPQLAYRKQTGNVPLAAAYLKLCLHEYSNLQSEIVPESISSYASDSYLIQYILNLKPSILCVTVYCWNLLRTIYICKKLKEFYNVFIIAGGPEISNDNYLLIDTPFDELVYGEGEKKIKEVIENHFSKNKQKLKKYPEIKPCFTDLYIYQDIPESPYLYNSYFENPLIEEDIESCMFLETQRGCPYKCSFCNYNKSREKLSVFNKNKVLKSIIYAYESPYIKQLYLMDPSLNTRPDLSDFINAIANINYDKKLDIFSEIRAENLSKKQIVDFSYAGFVEFEIGLQSTNPKALELMKRPTDLKKFTTSCTFMQENGIIPKVDLIIGLPGDDYDGFRKSVDFVKKHNLDERVQVFALSLLPGTEFRKDSKLLNLSWQEEPPYYLTSGNLFNRNTIINCFRYAESVFDITFDPIPIPDLSFKGFTLKADIISDVSYSKPITKIFFYDKNKTDIENLATKMSMPYQLWFYNKSQDPVFIKYVLSVFCRLNPFTPLEVILFNPKDTKLIHFIFQTLNILLKSNFLDNDLTFIYAEESKRNFIITCISDRSIPVYRSPMYRQFYLLKVKANQPLPDYSKLGIYTHPDGVLIDTEDDTQRILDWQNDFINYLTNSPDENTIPESKICFSNENAQSNWLKLNFSDEYYFKTQHFIFNVS